MRILVLPLLFSVLSATAVTAAPKTVVTVGSLAGYYVTDDRAATQKTLHLTFLGPSPRTDRTPQGDFRGTLGDDPLVGQAIVTGGTDDGRLPDDKIQFDFLYMQPQDQTAFLHSETLMRGSKVTGIAVGNQDDPHHRTRYRRVSATEFVRYRKAHPSGH